MKTNLIASNLEIATSVSAHLQVSLSREEVIANIMQEKSCSREEAERILNSENF